jgi:hypothetical protein
MEAVFLRRTSRLALVAPKKASLRLAVFINGMRIT